MNVPRENKKRKPYLAFSRYDDAPLEQKAYRAWYMRNIYRPKIAKLIKAARKERKA